MSGRVAVVTGGTRGIGEAISIMLRDAGYKVAAGYGGDDVKAKQFAEATGIPAWKWDVGDFDACRAAVAEIEKALGPIDILVNNAGITRDATMHKMQQDHWADVIRTNLTSCFNMCNAVFDGMRARNFGRIVNIGSINGQAGQYGQVNYAAAKSGIHGFTKALAQEGASKGITVNAKCAGENHRPHPGRSPGQRQRNRARRGVPGGGRGRVCDRIDAVDQWRPAYVLTRPMLGPGRVRGIIPAAPGSASASWYGRAIGCCWFAAAAPRAGANGASPAADRIWARRCSKPPSAKFWRRPV